ncbi:hypothetical protein BD770DRAFT_26945 [Pilaira anomala]|nr:hypothetical protein BD770DRAFT_26945 [Pilaira anomala]
MFSQLLDDLLMNDASITFYDGETVSQSTKRMKILTEDESEYGRRIDLIVKSKEAEEQYDLCSNKFKKTNVSIDVLTHQQSKNLRINACISNDINLLLGNTSTRINYFGFSGRQAYVSQLFNFDGCFVAYKVGSFTIPKDLIGLDQFRFSLITLYNWKKYTIDNGRKVIVQLSKSEEKYGLIDVSNNILDYCPSPLHRNTISNVSVVFSPSKGQKRIRPAVFVED